MVIHPSFSTPDDAQAMPRDAAPLTPPRAVFSLRSLLVITAIWGLMMSLLRFDSVGLSVVAFPLGAYLACWWMCRLHPQRAYWSWFAAMLVSCLTVFCFAAVVSTIDAAGRIRWSTNVLLEIFVFTAIVGPVIGCMVAIPGWWVARLAEKITAAIRATVVRNTPAS